MDAYAAEHGWLTPSGQPRGFAKFYVSLLNSERLALRALEGHLRERQRDPSRELTDYLEANYTVVNGDDD